MEVFGRTAVASKQRKIQHNARKKIEKDKLKVHYMKD